MEYRLFTIVRYNYRDYNSLVSCLCFPHNFNHFLRLNKDFSFSLNNGLNLNLKLSLSLHLHPSRKLLLIELFSLKLTSAAQARPVPQVAPRQWVEYLIV